LGDQDSEVVGGKGITNWVASINSESVCSSLKQSQLGLINSIGKSFSQRNPIPNRLIPPNHIVLYNSSSISRSIKPEDTNLRIISHRHIIHDQEGRVRNRNHNRSIARIRDHRVTIWVFSKHFDINRIPNI
jgi:hypothetical protein